MPPKNSIKTYIENGYYHIYNRGVEKRLIFQDNQDYRVYLSYLEEYLSPKDEKELRNKLLDTRISAKQREKLWLIIRMKNFSQDIMLFAYCLMPNHFHLFVKQQQAEAINKFMSSFGTRYSMYFNRKYDRVGALFQGRYKAVLIDSESQYLEITRYIHNQAISLQGATLQECQPSSYEEYIGTRHTPWVHPEEILSFFSNSNPALSYEAFVKNLDNPGSLENLTLDT